MTKKIILDILKKSKWSILLSVIILIYLYGEVSTPVFMYFCFLQLVITLQLALNNLQKEMNNAVNGWTDAATKKIKEIIYNLSEFRKIYDDVVAYIIKKDNIH